MLRIKLLYSLLSIPVLLGVFFFQQSIGSAVGVPHASAQSGVITPSFFPLAPCPTCDSPSISPNGSVTAGPTNGNTISPIEEDETEDPCESDTASFAHHKSKHWKHDGKISGAMKAILKFFMELINLLLKLLGGGNIPLPDPSEPLPSIAQPSSSVPGPSSSQPDPTINPCPSTGTPSQAVPSSVVPSISGAVPSSGQPPISGGASGTPGATISLTNWKLTLPTGSTGKPTEILQPQLANYSNDPWYLPSSAGNGIRFRSAVNGVTTSGSTYPRSELREMNGSSLAAWSSSTGTHTMTIDQAITAVPKTKKHVVAGQIHDGEDDVIVIRLELPKLIVDVGGTEGAVLDANYTLGKRFSVKFEVKDNKTNIYYGNSTTPAHTITKTYSGAYFKAGAYTQSNCSTETGSPCDETNYGEVMIYSLSVTHQ